MPTTDPAAIVDQLQQRYSEATGALRTALAAYLQDGQAPDPQARAEGAFTYPELKITAPHGARPRVARAYAGSPRPASTPPPSPGPSSSAPI
jgi:AMP nucleosidase